MAIVTRVDGHEAPGRTTGKRDGHCIAPAAVSGATENAGPENEGPKKHQ